MANIYPTKELVEMIEQRIPFGRPLTTVALLLGLAAVIVAACVYLYHVIILPLVALIIAGFTTGKINPSSFASFIGSGVAGLVFYLTAEKVLGGHTRTMTELLEHSKSLIQSNELILKYANQVRGEVNDAFTAIRKLEFRLAEMEEKKGPSSEVRPSSS